ncbi:MAG: hypothetical protein Q7R67_02295 [bacterium]|nr:hypothetical protein [bacterium]
MKKYFIFIVALLVVGSGSWVSAQEAFVGPGGCTSKEECRTYCDEDSHKEECLNFAVENGMMTEEEADKARKFMNQTGPGGCQGEECRTYCEDRAHREECLNFAEKNGFISKEEAAKMRKFQAIEAEGGPGGCKREECRTYCDEVSHREECFKFAKEKGLISEEEVEHFEQGQKILEKIKESGGPGGCRGEEECHSFCSDPANVEECVTFAGKNAGLGEGEARRMLEEFKNHKDQIEQMRQMRPDRKRPEGTFKSDFGDGEFKDGEFQKNFQQVPEQFRDQRNPERPLTEEEMKKIQEKYRENAEKYRGQMLPQGAMPEEMRARMQVPEGERMQYDNFRPENFTPPNSGGATMPPPTGGGMMPPPMPTSMPTTFSPDSGQMMPPPTNMPMPPSSEPMPTSYDHSRSFLSNGLSAFLAPFRK